MMMLIILKISGAPITVLKQFHFIDGVSDPNVRGSLAGMLSIHHTGPGRQIFRRQPFAEAFAGTGTEISGITHAVW